ATWRAVPASGPPPHDSGNGVEAGHHRHIFVLEIMAVQDEPASVVIETNQDLRLLARSEIDGVLNTLIVGSGSAGAPGHHAKPVEVGVDRVMKVRGELPDLRDAQPHAGDARIRVERGAIDCPAGHASDRVVPEAKLASDHSGRGWRRVVG